MMYIIAETFSPETTHSCIPELKKQLVGLSLCLQQKKGTITILTACSSLWMQGGSSDLAVAVENTISKMATPSQLTACSFFILLYVAKRSCKGERGPGFPL